MKILFLSRLFYPHVGGVEKHLQRVSLNLIKRGHSVTILTTRFEQRLKDKENLKGVKLIRFVQPKVKYFGIFQTWLWLLRNRNLIRESDIVHIHDVFIWYWPLRLLYPRKKVYVTFHGRWGKYPIPFVDKFQKKIGSKLSSGVISIGEYIDKNYGIKSDVLSYGAVKQHILVSTKKQNIFLYVGRLDKDTPLKVFLETLKKYTIEFKEIKVIFCGDGELAAECKRYGKVTGWTEPEKYYQTAKFVFASGYLTILEALSNKCMVFASYLNPLQKDYYQETPFRKNIILVENSGELYKRFHFAQKNYNASLKFVEDGYDWAITQTWDKMTENYLKLWKI